MHSMLRTGFCVCMLLSTVLSTTAQRLDIKGTVLDANNAPLAGAVVSLTNQEGSDTTDVTGAYHIITQGADVTLPITPLSIIDKPQIHTSSLHFGVNNKTAVAINLYSLNGRLLKQVLNEEVQRGNWGINPFAEGDIASGLYLLTLSINGKVKSFKCINSGSHAVSGLYSISSNSASAEYSHGISLRNSTERSEALDTLIITVKGQEMTATPILEPVVTLPTNYVVQRDIYGDIIADGHNEIEQVFAVINKNGSTRRQFAELFYNKSSNSYSGFVYFMKSDTIENYTVETYVYSVDGLSAFSSEVVPFASNAGNIKMPTLRSSSSRWWYDLQIGDTLTNHTVEFGDTARLQLVFNDPKYILGDIIEYYWDNGEGTVNPDVKPIWDDTLPTAEPYKYLYNECRGYMVFGGFKTDFGQVSHRPQTLSVESNNGAITVLEPSVWSKSATINDSISLRVAGIDSDLISSWEINSYKLSGNVFDTILVTNLATDTLTYQVSTGLADTVNNYQIILVDKNGGYTMKTLTLRVTNYPPSLYAVSVPTSVPPGQKYTIDLSKATDDGTIMTYEYRCLPSVPTFTTIPAPLLLEFTSGEANTTNSVDIRLTDEDGNVTNRTYNTVAKNNPATLYVFHGDSASISDTVTLKVLGKDSDKIKLWTIEKEDGTIDTVNLTTPLAEDTLEYTIIAPDTVGTKVFMVSVVDTYGVSQVTMVRFRTSNRKPYIYNITAPKNVPPNTPYTINLSAAHDDGNNLKREYRFPPSIPDFVEVDSPYIATLTSGVLGTINKVDVRVTDNDGNISEKSLATVSIENEGGVILNVRQLDGTMKLVHLTDSTSEVIIPGTEEYGTTSLLEVKGSAAYIYPASKPPADKPENVSCFKRTTGFDYYIEPYNTPYAYSVKLSMNDTVVVWSQHLNWQKKDSLGYFEVLSIK